MSVVQGQRIAGNKSLIRLQEKLLVLGDFQVDTTVAVGIDQRTLVVVDDKECSFVKKSIQFSNWTSCDTRKMIF